MSPIPVAWFNETQYEQLREAQSDRDRLPLTWSTWFQNLERQLRSRGLSVSQVMRIEFSLTELAKYCEEHGMQMDQQGRVAYANAIARNRLKLERWWTVEAAVPLARQTARKP